MRLVLLEDFGGTVTLRLTRHASGDVQRLLPPGPVVFERSVPVAGQAWTAPWVEVPIATRTDDAPLTGTWALSLDMPVNVARPQIAWALCRETPDGAAYVFHSADSILRARGAAGSPATQPLVGERHPMTPAFQYRIRGA